MKLTLESTTQLTQIVTAQGDVPARVWIGHTDAGIPVQCLITRVAVHRSEDHTAFERELHETPHTAPPAPRAFDTRFVL